ncbi:YceI family protein [Foetidibacter luteolus]|uniref:YceI family protein n=1 Tax=Foetidibacter luteolus TaxID=2608880 RepID=UPI00129A398E|nr:YceI family protein [Foetidibacter luteolus]
MKLASKLFISASILLAACQSAPKADEAATGEKQDAAAATGATYTVDTTNSVVTWAGTKPTATHTGTFKIKDGSIAVENSNVTGGSFTIDIASLVDTDLTGEFKGKLEGHLKSPDFFDVAKFPTAKFEITKVEAFDSTKAKSLLPGATHLLSGNLTLKDSTKNVTFPAIVSITENALTAQANFNIDRTDWGMNYKGPDNPQDWVIKKEVNLQLNVKAGK